jgi:hypothetical protein
MAHEPRLTRRDWFRLGYAISFGVTGAGLTLVVLGQGFASLGLMLAGAVGLVALGVLGFVVRLRAVLAEWSRPSLPSADESWAARQRRGAASEVPGDERLRPESGGELRQG